MYYWKCHIITKSKHQPSENSNISSITNNSLAGVDDVDVVLVIKVYHVNVNQYDVVDVFGMVMKKKLMNNLKLMFCIWTFIVFTITINIYIDLIIFFNTNSIFTHLV